MGLFNKNDDKEYDEESVTLDAYNEILTNAYEIGKETGKTEAKLEGLQDTILYSVLAGFAALALGCSIGLAVGEYSAKKQTKPIIF